MEIKVTTWQIITLSLAVSVLGSSILIVVFRRKGWNEAADLLTRYEKLAGAAVAGKDGAEALKIVLDEILNPATETVASQRATDAALTIVSATLPPPPLLPKETKGAATILPLTLVCLLAHSLSGCSAAQLKSVGKALAPVLAGAVCDLAEKDDKQARFKCHTVVDEGSSVLSNMSTDERAAFKRRTPSAEFEVTVSLDQAEAFAAANGGSK